MGDSGGRNLPAYERGKLALKLENIWKEKAKENLITSTGGKKPQPLPKLAKAAKPPINTRKELARAAGVGTDTIDKIKVIEREATPEQKQDLSAGVKKVC